VEIWTRDVPPHTTSNIAAAIWHPFKVFPVERALGWGQRSLDVFYDLAADAESGVVIREALEVYAGPVEEPWWRGCVSHFRFARADELPEGRPFGYVFETAQVETRIYLPYLMRRFEGLGGKIVRREITNLADALSESLAVVNCAGLGTLAFLPDKELVPIRGQIIRVEKLPLERILLDEEEDGEGNIAYVVPRSNDCILGGVAQVGNWSLEPDEATAQGIIERCALLAPEVREARIVEHLVGLRPGRSSVRLEKEQVPGGGSVVHNYGHGGGGVTLSWGCAEDVVRLLSE
jgi:D-amino-acid oxidase